MHRNISRTKLITASLALSLGIFVCGLPTLTLAKFVPPAGRGLPGRREGAGTRSGCITNDRAGRADMSVIALVPETNLGLTVSEHPTFFWYIPPTTAKTVEFSLSDKNEKEVYKTSFAITGQPGVISISLPTTATLTPLALNELYQWKFSLVCVEGDASANIRRSGWVQRVAPSATLVSSLQKTAPRNRPNLYAAEGIWQEALTSLAELRRANPKDVRLEADWADLLKAVGLSKIAKDPILPSLQPSGTNQATSSLK